MKAVLAVRFVILLGATAISAAAQTPSASPAVAPCAQCASDEASRRALALRTERIRAEVEHLIKEAARQGSEADSTTLRQLSEALTRLKASERALKASTQALQQMQISRTPAAQGGAAYGYSATSEMPSGYMGVSLSGITEVKPGDGLVVLYRDTPIIESVEPGSPAARAGLESGDVILAYNGEEVKGRTVSLSKLLKPGAKVVVRVRRNGTTRDVPVIVGSRSRTFTVTQQPSRSKEPNVIVSPGFEFSFEVDSAMGATHARVASAPRARSPEPTLLPPLLTGTGTAFAGAELRASNEALGEYFGTARGIIVLHVAEATPARRAGILAGDVITHVDDEPVSRPSDFQRALARSKTRSVDVQILRRKTEKKALVLKW